MASTIIRLKCGYQSYDWGKLGSTSRVADLVGDRDPSKRFAELWIGTHPSKPAIVADGDGSEQASTLKHAFSTNPSLLGADHVAQFGTDVPFLLKVLSIDKALSIQAHPEKSHAERLHAADPKNYPDDNHKPELVVALTPFQAMCCFRPLTEVRAFIATVPQLSKLLPRASVSLRTPDASSESEKQLLRSALEELYSSDPKLVGDAVDERAAVLKLMRSADLGLADNVFLRVQSEFPRDVGCWMVYFLNIVNMEPGDGLFLAPNEPHSYLQGDCVEIMASSDNVVRAGLTPKFKDVHVLLEMLTYRTDALQGVSYTRDPHNPIQTYEPPEWCREFSLTAVRLDQAHPQATVALPSAALGVVVEGAVRIGSADLTKGTTFLIPAAATVSTVELLGSQQASVFIGSARAHSTRRAGE